MIQTIKEVRHQLYCRSAFDEIVNNPILQDKYAIVGENGKKEENLRVTKMNVLYMFVPVPDKIKPEEYDAFLDNYLKLLNESFIELLLHNVIQVETKVFKDDDDKVTFLLKFYRPFKIWWLIRSFLEVVLITTLTILLIKYL